MATAAAPLEFRQALLKRLAEARRSSDELFRIVRPEAVYDRPIPERHRIIFYLGHLEAFDWNLLNSQIFGLKSLHESFDKLFAFGIDPVGGGLPDDPPSAWPVRAEIELYNLRLRETLDAQLVRAAFDDPKQPLLHDGFLLNVAIEHRLMHAETLAYMLHQLPLDRKSSEPQRRVPPVSAVSPGMIEIPPGVATLGMPFPSMDAGAQRFIGGTFGWDNEFPELRVDVPAFSIDALPVTNGEFLRFVEEDGYQHHPFWTDFDWKWKEQAGIWHPAFWRRQGDSWFYRALFEEIPLPLDWPVYVSHAEASGYARWAGKELPTEAEWHRAAYGTPDGAEREFPWGNEAPAPLRGNFDFARWDPSPVTAHSTGQSAFGVYDLLGNGWEWTSTVFAGFPGFEAFPFYAGYSANFFDGQHYVMKGGSPRTAACMLRRTFRNWFQPHYPFVYATFRCVKR
jgi:ergothioneine biosynthesis protein EgtB